MIANLAAAGRDAIERWGRVDGAAVGVPGLFDDRTGTIEFLPNLPGAWKGEPMTAPLAAALGVPTAIINDARAFTLAESRLGAAAGCETVAALVLGTGIGGGIVVDGRLHFGPMGRAGELAHQVIVPDGPKCGCGNHGCLEALASSAAITRLAGTATVHEAFAAAAAGDERAAAALAEVADYLGIAIANLVTVLVPERVVIGGGVAEAGDALLAARARGDGPALRARPARLVRDRARQARPPRRGDRRRPLGDGPSSRRPHPMIWGGSVSDVDTDFPRRRNDTDLPQIGGQAGWVWTTSMT